MENPTAGISNKKLKYLKQDVRYNKKKKKKKKNTGRMLKCLQLV